MDYSRLSMPLGEAIFTQRSIRRFRPDPIPLRDVRLILGHRTGATSRSPGFSS
jgi:nitroreductase